MLIDSIPEESATGALAEYYRSQRERWGFLPNYAAALAPRPEVAAAWAGLAGAVVANMDRRRYELASIAAARASRNTYCTVAHTSFLRDLCHDDETIRRLVADPSGAGLEPEDRAVFAFATKLATDAASIGEADVDALRAVGLSDVDVADVVFAVAARAFFTCVIDGLGAQADVETARTFDDETLASMIVGRPPASAPDEPQR